MVGAERYDGTVGEPRGAAAPETRLAAVDTDAPEPGSYWADIDYPVPRPRARPPAPAVPTARPRRSNRMVAGVVAALVVVGAGSFAIGHANGHAPVPGLHRTIASQRAELRTRAAKIKSQASKIA